MKSEKLVVLSAPILIEEGRYGMHKISFEDAWSLVTFYGAGVYTKHQTVKILGLEPDKSRQECERYEMALVIKPKKRLDFGREYELWELKDIGFDILLIEKF